MNFTKDIESFVNKIKSKYNSTQLSAFITVLLLGILAHGYVIFNRISYHDNTANLFSLGATFEVERWGLGVIYLIQSYTSRTFAVPVFNGIISIIFIAFAAMLVVKMLDIKSRWAAVLVGAVMVVYPTVPSIFSFMFTAWPYFLALLFSVSSAYVISQEINLKNAALSIVFLALSLSIYQAFLGVAVTLLLLKLLLDLLNKKTDSILSYAKQGVIYLVDLAVGLGLYAIIAELCKKFIDGVETLAYKGRGDGYDISQLPAKIMEAVREFFACDYAGVNGLKYLRLLTLCIIIVGVIQIVLLVGKRAQNIGLMIAAYIGAAILPIGMNVIYMLSTSSEYYVDSLMVYADALALIIPLVLIENLDLVEIKNTLFEHFVKIITWLQIFAIVIIVISYIYLDNAAYMKADLAQEQASSYLTQLAANIKSCDGFSDDMEIVFVDLDKNNDGTFVTTDTNEQLDAIKIEKFPYYTDLVSGSSILYFMREHCGFGNELLSIDDGSLASEPNIAAMPAYPDDGSIAVVDGKVIVKFGD